MKTPEIIVSDHAVIRYIERHYGFSVEPIRAEILRLAKGAITAGAATLSVDGITFCFSESPRNKGAMVVTTVLERGMGGQKDREKRRS
jgi:hypothetical protein